MGPVKDRYIHYEKAGDQFCGRCATGISTLSKDFAVSPPHWDWSRSTERNIKDKVHQVIEDNLVRKDKVSATAFQLICSLFASLVYHYAHLDEHLHEESKLRGSPPFITSADVNIHELVSVTYP